MNRMGGIYKALGERMVFNRQGRPRPIASSPPTCEEHSATHECDACHDRQWVYALDRPEAFGCTECNGPLAQVRPEFMALPPEFQKLTFANWEDKPYLPGVREWAEAFARGEAEEKWGVFAGSFGWGKTGLAARILNYRAAHPESGGSPGKYVSVPDLLDDLKAGFDDGTYMVKMTMYQTVGLLMMDDLGTEKGTEWSHEKLFQILDYRYVRRLETLITINTSPAKIDPRLVDRFLDTGTGLAKVFSFMVPSYRTGEVREAR